MLNERRYKWEKKYHNNKFFIERINYATQEVLRSEKEKKKTFSILFLSTLLYSF